MRWLVWVLGVVLAATAWAHPMSKDKYSLRSAMQLAEDGLDVVVVLEVPMDVVARDLQADMEKARAQPDAPKAAQAVLDRYTQHHFDALAAGLTLTVDGVTPKGRWRPRDNRLNGKGAVTGGFFMYIVEFAPDGPLPLDGDVRVVVQNKGYTGLPMVYSGMVVAGKGWELVADSSKALLPDRPYDLSSPDFWVGDEALRRLEARFVRQAAP